MKGQGSHSTLVAHVEDDLVVDVDAVVQPLDFRRSYTGIAVARQQQASLWLLLLILKVKIETAGIGKL